MIKIEYICHACLLIDTGDLKIVTDPWFHGPAYCGQWNVFPKPVNLDALDAADCLLLSHGHEDHLHEPSLRRIRKSARVFYPFNWYGGTREYLRGMGFDEVREAVSGKTYRLTKDTSVTYLANNLDSIVVIESGGRVVVNVNDALHAYPAGVIDFFTSMLRRRWPSIDTVLCGFGGASYFPNTIHLEGKNDREIGALREQLFAHNFCRIVCQLAPRVAVPFAADFALLAPAQRWINEVRFPRAHLAEYYREHFGRPGEPQPEIQEMYSGDVLENDELKTLSPYRREFESQGSLDRLVDVQYKAEIEELSRATIINETDAEKLGDEIEANVRLRASLFDPATLAQLKFCVRVSDVNGRNCFNVAFDGNESAFGDDVARVARTSEPATGSLLVIDTSSRILRYSFGSEWGGDTLTIGYGCEVHVFDRRAVEAKLDTICLRLLTRHPTARGHMKKEPIRAVRHLARNPLMRTWALDRLKSTPVENKIYDQNLWLLRSKCDICQICDLPLIGDDFAAPSSS
ncbi:MAG: MBL fold metallo-hydrolase [Pyrinomonadaceae bacterium]